MRALGLQFFLLSLVTITTHAQSYSPWVTYLSSTVFVENQAMYVSGGYNASNDVLVGQMFWIDLSTSWSVSNPTYERLTDGIKAARIPNTLLDNNKWVLIANQTGYVYDINASNWTTIGSDVDINPSLGLSAVVDPSTDTVYIPNGYKDTSTGAVSLFVYSINQNLLTSGSMQPSLSNIINYAAVWAPTLKSMIVFGGNVDGSWITNNNLAVYNPTTGWTSPSVKGDTPPARTLACMVPAYSGTKMILFGGIGYSATNQSGPILSDIYTLDVASFTWTRGADMTVSGGRAEMSCAVSGDYFISWGGASTVASDDVTVIYNMKTAAWTNQYVPGSSSSTKSNVAIIAGCVAGGVVLILLVAGFIWYRKKSKKNPVTYTEVASKPTETIAMTTQPQYQQPSLPAQYPPQQQQMQYAPYQPQVVDQKPNPGYQTVPVLPVQQTQQIYQPPVVTADPAAGYYQPSVSQAAGYYPPAEQPQQVYQPPVMATSQATSYYQPVDQPQIYQPADQQPQIFQPADQQPQIFQPADQQPQIYQPTDQQPQIYQPVGQQPHIYQPSPVTSDQSTLYYHDGQSPQTSVAAAAAGSPQTNVRSPQSRNL